MVAWKEQKELGNQLFQSGDLTGAIDRYSEGIMNLCKSMDCKNNTESQISEDNTPKTNYEKLEESGVVSSTTVTGTDQNAALTADGARAKSEQNAALGQMYANRALCFFKQQKYQEAADDCTDCLRRLDGYPKALYRRALAFEALKNWNRALEDAILFSRVDKNLGPPLVQRLRTAAREDMQRQMQTSDTMLPVDAVKVIQGMLDGTALSEKVQEKGEGQADTDEAMASSLFSVDKLHEVARAFRSMTRTLATGSTSKKSLLQRDVVSLACQTVRRICDVEMGSVATDLETGEAVRVPASAMIRALRSRRAAAVVAGTTGTSTSSTSSSSSSTTTAVSSTTAGLGTTVSNSSLLSALEQDALTRVVGAAFEHIAVVGHYTWSEDEMDVKYDKKQPLPFDDDTKQAQQSIRSTLPLQDYRMLLRIGKSKILDIPETSTTTKGDGTSRSLSSTPSCASTTASSSSETLLSPSSSAEEASPSTFRFDMSWLLDSQAVLENAVKLLYFYSPNETKTYHGIKGKLEDQNLLDSLADMHDRLQKYGSEAGTRVVAQIADERRRMGELAKAYVPNQAFYKLVESLLHTSPACGVALTGCLAQLWFLLADTERPEKDQIDLDDVASKMILPFVGASDAAHSSSGGVEQADHTLLANGFLSLSTMFYVNTKAASSCLHHSSGRVLNVILRLCYTQVFNVQSADTRLAQIYASDVLVQCMRSLTTRGQIVDAGGVEMIIGILKGLERGPSEANNTNCASSRDRGDTSLQADQTRLLKAKLVCALALLAAHNEEVCCQIFEFTDFLAALESAFAYVKDLYAALAKTRRELEVKVLRGGGSTGGKASTGEALQDREGGGNKKSVPASPAITATANPFSSLPDERLLSLENQHLGEKELLQSREWDNILKLKRGFLEAFVYLSMHKDFKEDFVAKPELLKAFFCEFVRGEDIAADTSVGFLYLTILFNFFRSQEDKVRPRRKEYPFSELDDQQVEELEEFYKKMPEQHKAAQNGVVNAGSAALALKYREFVIHSEVCLERLRECCAPNILSALTLHGQMNLAMLFNFLTSNEDHSWRRKLMKAGAVPSLLRLHKMLVTGGAAKENGKALDACRQALAHIALVTNPELYPYQDAADLVPVMLLMARDSQNELHQFEACMALTNLAASAEVRDFVISADGWNYALDLLFSSNERVQCVAMELMNNLAGDEKIVEKMGKKCERCMEGKGVDDAPAEIKIMLSFCGVVTRNEAEMARLEKEEAEEEKEESDDEKIEDWPGRKKKPQVVQTKEESAGLKGGEGDGKDPNAELRNILCGRKKGKVDRAALDQNDKRMLIAASGCLAQLTQDTTICRMISVTPQFHHLLDLVAWSGPGADADAEFRAVAAICNLVACDEVIGHVRHLAQSAIEKKIASKTGLLHPKSKENYEFFKEWQKENGRL